MRLGVVSSDGSEALGDGADAGERECGWFRVRLQVDMDASAASVLALPHGGVHRWGGREAECVGGCGIALEASRGGD